MVRSYGYMADFTKEAEKLFRKAVKIGEGHNGIVYEVPGNKIIKIFQDPEVCTKEWELLYLTRKSKYYPNLYSKGDYYILREKIDGIRLDHYILKNGMSKRLASNLYSLLKEFDKLGFTKKDIRCRDMHVDHREVIRVIDPTKCYRKRINYPRHLMKGLDGIGALDTFLEYVRTVDLEKAEFFAARFERYTRTGFK